MIRSRGTYELSAHHEFQLLAYYFDGHVETVGRQKLEGWPAFEWHVLHAEGPPMQGLRLVIRPVSANQLGLNLFDPAGNAIELDPRPIPWPVSGGLSFRLDLSPPDTQGAQNWRIDLQRFVGPAWVSLVTPGAGQFATTYDFRRAWLRYCLNPGSDAKDSSGGVTVLAGAASVLRIPRGLADAFAVQNLIDAWDKCPSGGDKFELDKTRAMWTRYESPLRQEILGDRDLRRAMVQSNAGTFWSELLKRTNPTKTEVAELRARWEVVLRNYFSDRLHVHPPLPSAFPIGFVPPSYSAYRSIASLDLEAEEREAFDEYYRKFAAQTANKMFPPDSKGRRFIVAKQSFDLGDGRPTEVPHPVVIQVHEIGSLADARTGVSREDADGLHEIAGIGIVARQKNRTASDWEQWRLLNVARLDLAPDNGAEVGYELQDERRRAVVPLAISFRDGVRQAMFEYDNQPLASRSPLQGLADGFEAIPEPGAEVERLGIERLLDMTYMPNGSAIEQWGEIPGLKFGQTYEFAAFLISNSGGLPFQLADTDVTKHPARLCRFDVFDQLAGVPKGARREVTYVRRVPVGGPRVGHPTGKTDSFSWPRLPEGVAPFACEAIRRVEDDFPVSTPKFYVQKINGQARGQLDLSGGDWRAELSDAVLEAPYDKSVTLVFNQDSAGAEFKVVFARRGPGVISWAATVGGQDYVGEFEGAYGFRLDLAFGFKPQDGAFSLCLSARDTGNMDWETVSVRKDLPAAPNLSHAWVELYGTNRGAISCGAIHILVGDTPVEGEPGDTKPILLLAEESDPPREEFAWVIYPPAVDLETWDRWRAMDQHQVAAPAAIRDQRWKARAAFARYKNGEDSFKDVATFVDPAVVSDGLASGNGFALFELVPVRAPGGTGPGPEELDFPLHNPQKPWEGKGLKVTAKCAAVEAAASLTKDGDQISMTVPAGQVWELRVRMGIAEKWFDDLAGFRFHPQLRQGAVRYVRQDGNAYYLFTPWRLLVEAADSRTPSPQIVWNALTISRKRRHVSKVPPESPRDLISVEFVPPANARPTDLQRLALIKRLVLRRQMFRWEGRPLPVFPIENQQYPADPDRLPTGVGDEKNVMLWEASAFAGRRDDDSGFSEATTSPVGSGDCFKPDVPTSLVYQEDVTQDERALLYRFELVAESRYAALWPGKSEVRTPSCRDDFRKKIESEDEAAFLGVSAPVDWKRVIVPCRYRRVVPPPSVKVIVPLPGGNRPQDLSPFEPSLPALLVVLGDHWGKDAGFAESLEGRICRIADSSGGQVLELAPDPILSTESLSEDHFGVRIEGPTGHTFDEGATAPRFVGTSYVLRLDVERVGAKGEPLGTATIAHRLESLKGLSPLWPLAHLQLRRQLLVAKEDGNTLTPRPSEWTPPRWVQFVPDATQLEVLGLDGEPNTFVETSDLHVESCKIDSSGKKLGFQIVGNADSEPRALAEPTGAAGRNQFLHFGLLTERVSDVARRHDSERYVGLYARLDASGSPTRFVPVDAVSVEDLGRLAMRFRLLTVQRRRDRLTTDTERQTGSRCSCITYFDESQGGPSSFELKSLSVDQREIPDEWQINLPGLQFVRRTLEKATRHDGTLFLHLISAPDNKRMASVRIDYDDSSGALTGDIAIPAGAPSAIGLIEVKSANPGGPLDLRMLFRREAKNWRFRLEYRSCGENWSNLVDDNGQVELVEASFDERPLRIELELKKGSNREGWEVYFAPPTITVSDPVLWDELFPEMPALGEPLDAVVRLVAVSPPVDSLSSAVQRVLDACRRLNVPSVRDWELVQNVARELGIPICRGGGGSPNSANELYDALRDDNANPRWARLGRRPPAELCALAQSGWLLVAGLQGEGLPGHEGRVAIVTAGPLDESQATYPTGFWGATEAGPPQGGPATLDQFFSADEWAKVVCFAFAPPAD